jgi:hypothetical protein
MESSHVLYLFEPLAKKNMLPAATLIRSLATLSPYEDRVSEYKKTRCTELVFPCLGLSELLVVALVDPAIQLSVEKEDQSFVQFGGIVRHVLGLDTSSFLTEQKRRIASADPQVLRHGALTSITLRKEKM